MNSKIKDRLDRENEIRAQKNREMLDKRAARVHTKNPLMEKVAKVIAVSGVSGCFCHNAGDVVQKLSQDPEILVNIMSPEYRFGPESAQILARVSLIPKFNSEKADPYYFNIIDIGVRIETVNMNGSVSNVLAALTCIEAAARFAAILEQAVSGCFDFTVSGYQPPSQPQDKQHGEI